ncbi:MAG: prolipoprotein diacylglyceryl transferase [Clostridia bacterium]|nr:prolipoprotein diacylglyceryl transferase [Clostridia bacterium]
MKNEICFEELGISFSMDRIAFSIGNFDIYWYAVIITFGLILAVGFCMWNAPKFGLTIDNVLDVLLCGLPVAVICARVYYVLFKLDQYDSFGEMINIRDGGLAIYGGVIGAFVTGFVYCRIKKVNLLALFDLGSFGFLIGQAIGRWGNFVNAEAYGEITDLPWGMTINGHGPYHPTFLYESLWNIFGFVLLLIFAKKWMKHHGEVFSLYFAWYGLGRFFIEGLRTDSLYLGSIRVSQLLAALFFVAGIMFFIGLRTKIFDKIQKKTKKEKTYQSLFTTPETELKEDSSEESESEIMDISREITEENENG